MTDQTPIWLMDVDGPLNVMHLRMPVGHRSFKAGNGFQITYREALLERMAKLHADGKVELQWLTTWEELADVHLAEELGLPRGLVVAGTQHDNSDSGFYWWKLNVVKKMYEEGHRLIWTDDDIAFEWSEAQEWLEKQDPDRLIWDAPDEMTGITDDFVDRVEAWL